MEIIQNKVAQYLGNRTKKWLLEELSKEGLQIKPARLNDILENRRHSIKLQEAMVFAIVFGVKRFDELIVKLG